MPRPEALERGLQSQWCNLGPGYESLAHDNGLVAPAGAHIIFDSVTNLLRFLRSLEGAAFDS